jgi:DNA-binding transcriptional regulator GbsR (MarR family)
MAPSESELTKLHEAELTAAEAVGTLIEFWGFKRQMGRIWTLLYLSDEPLGAAEICERLQLSAGAASMTLAELEHWGVVQRLRKAGDRRDFFSAETDLWKMISRVWRERELRQIERAIDAFERARKLAEPLSKAKGAPPRYRFKAERLRLLTSLARLGEALAKAVLENGKLDLSPLRGWRAASGHNSTSPDDAG